MSTVTLFPLPFAADFHTSWTPPADASPTSTDGCAPVNDSPDGTAAAECEKEENPWDCTWDEMARIKEMFDRRWFLHPPIDYPRLEDCFKRYPARTFAVTSGDHPKVFWLYRIDYGVIGDKKGKSSLAAYPMEITKEGKLLFEGREYRDFPVLIEALLLLHPLIAFEAWMISQLSSKENSHCQQK